LVPGSGVSLFTANKSSLHPTRLSLKKMEIRFSLPNNYSTFPARGISSSISNYLYYKRK
jgi:hypothetical protein